MSDTYPLVTIAIPVFNGDNFLREAIDSVLAQTYPNCEIIVVNDGSSDDGKTEKICLSYGKKIRYFYKENGGVSSALNLALRAAQGEYFCWLSHDDVYLPDKVHYEVQLIQSIPNNLAVVYCHYGFIDKKSKYLYKSIPNCNIHPDQAPITLLFSQWLHSCSILAPISVFNEFGGFQEDLPTTQDYDLLIKIGLKYPFFEVPFELLYARIHPNQGSLTEFHKNELEKFFENHIPMLSKTYMHHFFEPLESSRIFVNLGKQMYSKGYSNSILTCAHQLYVCEKNRLDTDSLWKALKYLYNLFDKSTSKFNHVGNIQNRIFSKILNPKIIREYHRFKIPIFFSYLKQISYGIFETLDFDLIYSKNRFNGFESYSGKGSSLFHTIAIREEFPKLCKQLGVNTILDIPCGDWNWMQYVNLTDFSYTGGDIVQEMIHKNQMRFGNSIRSFHHLNMITDSLPKVDLILCRDCLVHLSFKQGISALENFKESGSKWLLTTTFTSIPKNFEITRKKIWRPLNLEKAPYNLPKAEVYINEKCREENDIYPDKSLGLWRLN